MKYRKWDPKTKMQIILESLEGKIPLAELCNKYQIRQSMYYYWLKEIQAKGYKVFESEKQTKKEQKLQEETKRLKRMMRTIKEDFIWVREFSSPGEFTEAFRLWVEEYNNDYSHSSLKYRTPCQFEKEQLMLTTKI